jgi:hypothetical protein
VDTETARNDVDRELKKYVSERMLSNDVSKISYKSVCYELRRRGFSKMRVAASAVRVFEKHPCEIRLLRSEYRHPTVSGDKGTIKYFVKER